jgi:uncharacterized protein
MDLTVTDAPESQRYEAHAEERLAGFMEYQVAGKLFVITHTEVVPEFEGHGVGGALVRTALDALRADGRYVLPLCPFAKAWIGRHPDYADLIYDKREQLNQ